MEKTGTELFSLIDEKRLKKLEQFQADNGIKFHNIDLLNTAFCHSSYINELPANLSGKIEDNERLEFLGDSVLALIVTEYLYKEYPDYTEGRLSEIKSIIVSEFSLANAGRRKNLKSYILLGRGEMTDDLDNRDGILSDTVEAVIGAYYLDSGFDKVREFVIPVAKAELDNIAKNRHRKDYKSALQFYIQQKYKKCPMYKTIKEEGPEHNKLFHVEVVIENEVYGRGKGHKKKSAQQKAAKEAINRIKQESPDAEIL